MIAGMFGDSPSDGGCSLIGSRKVQITTDNRHEASGEVAVAGFSMRDDGGLSIDRLDN